MDLRVKITNELIAGFSVKEYSEEMNTSVYVAAAVGTRSKDKRCKLCQQTYECEAKRMGFLAAVILRTQTLTSMHT